MNHVIAKAALIAVALIASSQAFASPDEMEIDSHFRAKISKERVKIAAAQRRADEQGQGTGQSAANCGSQSIGNVNTGGRIGQTPREVFVFAPNAINLVNSNGCR